MGKLGSADGEGGSTPLTRETWRYALEHQRFHNLEKLSQIVKVKSRGFCGEGPLGRI